jgi:hypothetical protein
VWRGPFYLHLRVYAHVWSYYPVRTIDSFSRNYGTRAINSAARWDDDLSSQRTDHAHASTILYNKKLFVNQPTEVRAVGFMTNAVDPNGT